MRALRFLIVTVVLTMFVGTTEAQFLRRLGNAAKNAAERAATRNTERAVERAVDKAMDADTYKGEEEEQQQQNTPGGERGERGENTENTDGTDGKVGDSAGTAASTPPPQAPAQTLEMTYAKSDFVAGDEIMFDDDVTREQVGEFPSQWDLLHGTVEIAQLNGEKVILGVSQNDPRIAPLFEDMKSYLPEKFTIEFDFWVGPWAANLEHGYPENQYKLRFYKADSRTQVQHIYISGWYGGANNFNTRLGWDYTPGGGGDGRSGSDDSFLVMQNSWNHFSLSFNQRAMKVYINGVRYANIPNTEAPGYFELTFYRGGGYHNHNSSIKNFRIAKGAVPLYDRMMSDGKFVTYGITFDVGKSTIKPESMGEINRIVALMNENPDLRFSVEGHTDSTGTAASNQTLSEARSAAIVARLTELGISADRLSASGKGQNSPIADNSTDEGRAKNRRVEFVKQ